MKTINKIILFSLALLVLSCEDIIETDISDDIIQIISPQNNSEIVSNVVTFQWNSLKGANKYRVQVYGTGQTVVLDSLVTKTNFTYPLSQGDYQWRVRGENSAYESSYSFPVNFSVIETDDLSNQQVILNSPANGLFTNSTSLICSWQNISAAEYYELEVTNITNGQTIIYQQSNITATSAALSNTILTQDAEYQWKIKGVNSSSQTPFFSRNFSIDRVNPNQPQNNLPANNSIQIINNEIDFSWNSPTDNGVVQSSISYIIEFSNDITFTNIFQVSNSSSTSFQQSFSAAGIYYWRIKATDLAGNNSIYSTPFKFTIN